MRRRHPPSFRPGPTTLAAVAALLAGALPATARAADPPPPAATAPLVRVLSDEHRVTRWAQVAFRAPIRSAPSRGAARIGRLHPYTEDGFPEVYLLLRSRTVGAGREWIRLRVPGRPNGRVGWVPREALGAFHLTRTAIAVDRRRLRLRVFVRGRPRWSAPVGIGAPGTPTPAGRFWIREVFAIHDRASGYWPYAFGTSAYSRLTDWPGGGVVGIHGPYFSAAAIPGRISHGCVRLRAGDAARLARFARVGTPVRIR